MTKTVISVCIAGASVMFGMNTEAANVTIGETELELTIRQSAFDGSKANKPATIAYIRPDDGESSTSIDIGVTAGWEIGEETNWYIGPAMELHRNNQTNKEQNTNIAQLAIYGFLGDVSVYNYCDMTCAYVPIVSFTVGKKRDKVKDSDSTMITAEFQPYLRRVTKIRNTVKERFGFNTMIESRGGTFKYLVAPAIGMIYESNDKAPTDESVGDVLWGKAGVQFELHPSLRGQKGNLALSLSYTKWMVLSSSDEFDELRDSTLRTIALEYKFTENVGLGFEHIDGGDPRQGLQDQEFSRVAVRIQF